MPVPYFNYFLGKATPEFLSTVDPEESTPPQMSPETLGALGLTDSATPEEIQQELSDREKARSMGLVPIDFSEPMEAQINQGVEGGSMVNVPPPAPAWEGEIPDPNIRGVEDLKFDWSNLGDKLGTTVDTRRKTNQELMRDIVPSLDEDQEPKLDVINKTVKTPASNTLNWLNKVTKPILQSTVQLLQSPANLVDNLAFGVSDLMGEGEEYRKQMGYIGEDFSKNTGLNDVRNWIEETLPTVDTDSFWDNTVPYGLGSALWFLMGGVAGSGAKLGTTGSKVLSGLLGAGSQSQQMYEEARMNGATDEEAMINFLAGTGIGASEGVLGLGRIYSQMGKKFGGSIMRAMAEGGVEEAFQELSQNIAQNFTVQQTFDASVNLLDGAGESVAFALMSGGVFTGLSRSIQKLANDPNISEDDRIKLSQAQENLREYERQAKTQTLNDIKESYEIGKKSKEEQMGRLNSRLVPTFISSTKGERTIKNIVRAHNSEGGSSFSAKGRVTQGFSVSVEEGTGMIVDGKKITEKHILDFIEKKKHLLKNPNNIIGTWYNPEDGKTHIDVSTVVKTEDEAMEIGRANNQLAIWDFRNKESINVLPANMQKMKKQQEQIPIQHQIQLYHFSPVDKREITTNPKRFGENTFTGNDVKASRLPRTFFFSDPRDAQQEQGRFDGMNLYTTTVDMRKVYNLSQNAQKYGVNEYGNIDIDEALRKAKADGWVGVRYDIGGRQIYNIFNQQFAEKVNPTPTMGEIVSGKFNKMVKDAQKRLNNGTYGTKSYQDISTLPSMGTRFLSDIGLIMGSKLADKSMKLGTPREFMNRLIEEYGEMYPAVKRYAREIYEYAKVVKDEIKKSPLTDAQVDELHTIVKDKLAQSDYSSYIPTSKGIIVLSGDMLAFDEEGRPQQLGVGFPKAHALRASRQNAEVKMVKVAFRDPDGKVYQGGETMHFKLADEIMSQRDTEAKNFEAMLEAGLIEDGFIGNDGKFYTREDTRKVLDDDPESFNLNIAVMDNYGSREEWEKVKRQKEAQKARIKSYPIWATELGVAKQISESATLHGNDTVVFVTYPNAWDAVKVNRDFQANVRRDLVSLLGEDNVPKLPSKEDWRKQSVKDKYIQDIKKIIASEIKKGSDSTIRKVWKLDNIAYKWGIENGENLAGKILGVAKFKQVNFDMTKEGGKDFRKSPHPSYSAEIEGYNYQDLDEPISFTKFQEDTKGTDVGVFGSVKEMHGEEREARRRSNMFRWMQQHALSAQTETPLVQALVDMSNGDYTKLNQWIQDNPDFQGEIYDDEKHQLWLSDPKRREEVERLRAEANASMEDIYRPANLRTNAPVRDSKGRPPSHPDYEGGVYLASLFDQRTWNSMLAFGKAIGRGAKSFGEFAQKMIKQFGDWIKPALRAIFKGVNQMPNVFKKAGKTEVDYATQTQPQTKPTTVNQEQSKKNQLMGRTPSVTTGYNMGREHPKLNSIVDRILEGMRKEFDERRRGTISNEQLKEDAKRRAEHLTDDDIWNVQIGDIANAEQTLAYRIYVLNKLLINMDELSKLNKTTPTLDIKKVTNNLANAMRMYEIVRALGTEAGRVVQSFNIPMGDEFVSQVLMGLEAFEALDPNDKLGAGKLKDMIEEVAGKDKNKEDKATFWEWTRYIFYNWILQNPLTDIANTFGNFSNLGFHITANIGNLGGMRTLLKGIKLGMREGVKSAQRVIHGEELAQSKFSEWAGKADAPATTKRSMKNYLRLLVPTTRLGIEDSFFRALGRNIELSRMSYKVGKQIGIAPDEVANAVSEIINDPDLGKYSRREYQQMAEYVQQIEDELVFQKELGKVGKGFSMISKVAFPIMPFVKTPLNILKFGFSTTPAGALKLFKSDLSSEEKNQIIRRALAGSVVMSAMAGMIAQGLIEITGGGSDDPFERDLMEKMGYKPYHLYVKTPLGTFGGSYRNVNPLNTPMSVMGDLFDKYRFNKMNNKVDEELGWYDKVAQDLSTALLATGSSITDQSYLSGVRDLMDALSGRNPDWLMRTLTGYTRMGAIQGTQQILGTADRGSYDTKGRMLEQVQKNSPFFSNEGLIESVSAFGDQRQSSYERFPLPITEVQENTAYSWMRDNGLKLKIPSKTTKIGNRELNRAEYEIYAKRVGKIMNEVVNKIWENQTDPELTEDKKLTLEQIQKQLDKAYDKATDDTKEKIKQMIIEQYQLNQKGNK